MRIEDEFDLESTAELRLTNPGRTATTSVIGPKQSQPYNAYTYSNRDSLKIPRIPLNLHNIAGNRGCSKAAFILVSVALRCDNYCQATVGWVEWTQWK